MIRSLSQLACSLCLAVSLPFAAGCSSYEFSVNDRVVFSPEPLFTEYSLIDDALQTCIEEQVERLGVRSASELTDLNCSQAGIVQLAGIETFSALSGLKLSGNQIVNLEPLAALSQLTELYIDNNRIRDASVLQRLEDLQILKLSGNPDLRCDSIPRPRRREPLDLPEQCR